jgi:hypothetical protein
MSKLEVGEKFTTLCWTNEGLGNSEIRGLVQPYTQDVFAMCLAFVSDVRLMNKYTSDFIAVEEDYAYFCEIKEMLARTHKEAGKLLERDGLQMMLAYAEAQRRSSNFLSSASAFRDRSKTRLSRLYGKESKELSSYESFVRSIYDENFSYRIMYNLRNYSQHENSPISLIPVNLDKNQDKSYKIKIELRLHKNDLISNDRVQSKVRKQLAETPVSTFDLNKLSRDFMLSHLRIYSHIYSALMPNIILNRNMIIDLYSKDGMPEGASPAIMNGTKTTDGFSVELTRIPLDLVEYFEVIAEDFVDPQYPHETMKNRFF